MRIKFAHELDEPSIIHWHGLLLPSRMDGHPRDAIQRGQTYVYEFEVANRAGTYWYHPHPDHFTASQVMRGLAGLFIVTDDEEAAAGLPSGEYNIPLVIQDRTFSAENQISYLSNETMPGMPSMNVLMGFLGEQILVNGQVTPLLPVATRAYRLRMLNGSNSRVYKLGWSTGAPVTVLTTDGGLLEQPVQRPYVMLGPGERVDLWADFTQFPVGSEVTLQSLAFLGAEGDSLLEGQPTDDSGSMPGMDHGGMTVAKPVSADCATPTSPQPAAASTGIVTVLTLTPTHAVTATATATAPALISTKAVVPEEEQLPAALPTEPSADTVHEPAPQPSSLTADQAATMAQLRVEFQNLDRVLHATRVLMKTYGQGLPTTEELVALRARLTVVAQRMSRMAAQLQAVRASIVIPQDTTLVHPTATPTSFPSAYLTAEQAGELLAQMQAMIDLLKGVLTDPSTDSATRAQVQAILSELQEMMKQLQPLLP